MTEPFPRRADGRVRARRPALPAVLDAKSCPARILPHRRPRRPRLDRGACAKLPVPEDPDDPAGAKIRARHRDRARDRDQGEARSALPLAGGPGQGAIEGFAPLARRLCRHPARARSRAGGPARHRRLQPARLRHAGRRARERRAVAGGSCARSRGNACADLRGRAAVLHDEHRRARPRGRARGARLRADQHVSAAPTARASRSITRAATRSTRARSCWTASCRRRSRWCRRSRSNRSARSTACSSAARPTPNATSAFPTLGGAVRQARRAPRAGRRSRSRSPIR